MTDREPHAAMLRHLDHCERAIDAMLKASSTAIDFLERRVETLMLDPLANVELLEDIQAEGGAAHGHGRRERHDHPRGRRAPEARDRRGGDRQQSGEEQTGNLHGMKNKTSRLSDSRACARASRP